MHPFKVSLFHLLQCHPGSETNQQILNNEELIFRAFQRKKIVMSESNNEQSSSDVRQKNNNDQWLDEQDHFLLKRILKYEMTTQEEVQKGLSIYYQQKKEKKAIRLGGVLVQNGIITQNELELFDTFQDMNKVTEMDRSFAALALKNKLVTLEQIKLAFQKQAEHFKKTKQIIVIGDILQKLGIMTTAYRDAILSRQQRLDIKYKDTSFGAVAIKMGLATCDQIDDALAIQQKLFSITNKLQLLGNILVDNNVLTEAQTRQILSHQKELKHQAEEREKTHSEKQKKKQKQSGNTQKTIFDVKKYINIIISRDKFEARILPIKSLPAETTLDDILFALSEKNIKYGVVDHYEIRAYLKTPSLHKSPWLIARGKPPQLPQHESIIYKFQIMLENISCRTHKSLNHLSWDKWPKAKSGDLLAEKKPSKIGIPGISVHAEIVEVAPPKTVQLINGIGTKLSDDGDKLMAVNDGLISSYMWNKICVLPEKMIDGDLNLNKEPLRYKGVLHVKGRISGKAGVKSIMIFAQGLENAFIQTESDVIILGNVNHSTIQAKGHVVARNIRHSKIEAFGYIVAEQNIESSIICSSGQVSVLTGSVSESEINAYKGILAHNVASNQEKQSILSVGIDRLVKTRIEKIQSKLPILKQNLDKLSQRMHDIKESNPQLNEKIKKFSTFIGSCQTKMDELASNKTINPEKRSLQLAKIEQKKNDAQKAMQDKKKRIQKNKDQYQQCFKSHHSFQKHIKSYNEELITLTEWLDNFHEPPGIVVSETIQKGTKIVSANCEKIIDKDFSHVYIKAVHMLDEGTKFQIEALSDAPN